MKAHKLHRLLKETGETAVTLIHRFEEMVDNTDENRERELLERLKNALSAYKAKTAVCKKNGLSVKISIEPRAIKIKTVNPSLEILLTPQDLKILRKMKISVEDPK